jgi:zinc protease
MPGRMRARSLAPAALALAAGLASFALPAVAAADGGAADVKVDIPFTRTTLGNGLVVILHEDHALPLVSVNTMVHVGSHFEEAGRTGFAHLFEHLMFMGTARAPTRMFDAWMESEGGSNNAWTAARPTPCRSCSGSRPTASRRSARR